MELKVSKPNRCYESVIIFHPDATETDQKSFFSKQKSVLESFKGEFNHIDTWGKRRLSNPIEKVRMGTFFHTTFVAQPECVAELERTMRINDQILRFINVKLDDRKSITQHLEAIREIQKRSVEKEQEREKAFQRKQANRRKPN